MGETIKLEATTNAGGTGSVSYNTAMRIIYEVSWDVGTCASGVDLTLTTTGPNGTAKTLLTLTNADADARYYLRLVEHDNTGTALTTTSAPLVTGLVTLNITNGGDTKTGTMYLHCIEA